MEKSRCGAKTRSGGRCQKYPMRGRTRCALHGGKSKRGREHPNYQGKGYSKDLPTRLADKYEESQSDPELVGYRNSILLFDTRMRELIGKIDDGAPYERWRTVKEAFRQYTLALLEGEEADTRDALSRLDHAINVGMQDYHAWREIRDVDSHLRRLKESELKAMIAKGQMISAERLTMFMVNMITGVETIIDDPNQRKQLGDFLRKSFYENGN